MEYLVIIFSILMLFFIPLLISFLMVMNFSLRRQEFVIVGIKEWSFFVILKKKTHEKYIEKGLDYLYSPKCRNILYSDVLFDLGSNSNKTYYTYSESKNDYERVVSTPNGNLTTIPDDTEDNYLKNLPYL